MLKKSMALLYQGSLDKQKVSWYLTNDIMPPTMSHSQTDPDRDLVHRARRGDFEAFDQLVTRYERPLYKLAVRIVQNTHDAEEVVQDSFLSALEHLKDFHEQSAFHTWLVRIATNHALKVLRKRRGLPMTSPTPAPNRDDDPLPHPDFIAPWREDPRQIAQRRETRELLDQALQQLDEKYRLVFLLRDVEGFSTEEAAQALEITQANVKVRLLRARLMLREQLTQTFGDAEQRVAPHQHE